MGAGRLEDAVPFGTTLNACHRSGPKRETIDACRGSRLTPSAGVHQTSETDHAARGPSPSGGRNEGAEEPVMETGFLVHMDGWRYR